MQKLLNMLPIGVWAAFVGGVVGVLTTYIRSGEWRNYVRMLSEIIPAMAVSGGVAELLLPVENFVTCFFVSIFVGGIVGFALDYWQQIGRYVVHNAIVKINNMFIGGDMPPPDFDDEPPKSRPPPKPIDKYRK